MDLMLQIPDDIAPHLTEGGGDLSRVALESVALEALRAGRITKVQLRKMLGLERIELDGFFKSHGVYDDYTMEDFEAERQALEETVHVPPAKEPAPVAASVIEACERLKTFGKNHGLSLGGLTLRELRHEAWP
jgi:hypothetical protein